MDGVRALTSKDARMRDVPCSVGGADSLCGTRDLVVRNPKPSSSVIFHDAPSAHWISSSLLWDIFDWGRSITDAPSPTALRRTASRSTWLDQSFQSHGPSA